MNRLKDKIVWVTGAGSGIGRAAAIALAREGATLVLSGRREPPLRETAASIQADGAVAVVKPGDLAHAATAAQIAEEIRSRFGRLDILVNNAGLNISRRSWAELDASGADQVLNGNLSSAFYCVLAALPIMRALSHAECAALALAGLTALVSIEDTLQLVRGETILIQGGAGGVAGFAIQLAKHIGARVVTTASAANHAYVRGLGADEVIDYRTEDFTQKVSACDAVFDTVGGDVALKSFAVLRSGGRAAFIASGASAPSSPRADVRAYRPQAGRDRGHLERIVALVLSGAVRPPEIRRYPLSAAAAAHAMSEGRHLRGKLVFDVR